MPPTPTESRDEAVALVRLPDEQYFAFDDDHVTALQARLSALSPAPLPPPPAEEIPVLVAAGAPRSVDLGANRGIPVLLATIQSALRRWSVDPDQNVQLVVTDVRTGAVRTRRPFMDTGRDEPCDPSGSGDPPNEEDAGSTIASVRRVDVGLLVDHVWRPSRIAVTFFIHDLASNTVVLDLVGGEKEPEVTIPRAPSPALTTVAAGPDTPAPDDTAGLGLNVPEQVAAGAPIPVHAAVDIPLRDAAHAPRLDAPTGSVLLASLLYVRLDAAGVTLVDLAAPATVTGEGDGARIQAAFGLDVRNTAAGANLSGKYQVYLVAGARVLGPRSLHVAV